MKIYILLSLVTLYIIKTQGQLPQQKLNACQKKTGASQNDVNIVKRKEIPTSPAGKCYLACVFEASGLMRNGRYNEPGAFAVAQRAYRKNPAKFPVAKRVLNTCKPQVNKLQDKCQIAAKLAVCTTQLSERFKL